MPHKPYAPESTTEHAKFIDDLGGSIAVARAINKRLGTDLKGQAVSNWKSRGIPYRYRGTLVIMANEKDGVSTPKDFFGIEA